MNPIKNQNSKVKNPPPSSLRRFVASSLLVLWWAVPTLQVRNVDLSTVPKRNTVQLTIYNSEDLTLVRETAHGDVQEGRQSVAVLVGQYAD